MLDTWNRLGAQMAMAVLTRVIELRDILKHSEMTFSLWQCHVC